MDRPANLIDLEHETAYFGELIEKEAPQHAIDAEFDRLCMEHFRYIRSELTGQVPAAVLCDLDSWSYEEVLNLGYRHGFDFAEKAGKEEYFLDRHVRYVIVQWVYFAEMLIAKECGYFPTSPEDVTAVKLNRDARRFEEHVRRERQKPRTEALEREQVFGKDERTLRPGTIVAPGSKGKDSRGIREIRVEVRPRDRRPPHGPPKRP